MHLRLNSLHKPEEVKRWFTTHCKRQVRLRAKEPFARDSESQLSRERCRDEYDIEIPSFISALMLVAPSQLLNWSIVAFLVGIGIYFGIVFTERLGDLRGANANLAVLLAYIIFTTVALLLYFVPAIWKTLQYAKTFTDANEAEMKQVLDHVETKLRASHSRTADPTTLQEALQASVDAQRASLRAQEALLNELEAARPRSADHHGNVGASLAREGASLLDRPMVRLNE